MGRPCASVTTASMRTRWMSPSGPAGEGFCADANSEHTHRSNTPNDNA